MSTDSALHDENFREARYNEFVKLLAKNDQLIRRFIRSILPTREGVDDVMQETALECWNKFSDFQPASANHSTTEFVRWACVIARFKAMSWQRDRSRDRLVFRESLIEQLSQTAMSQLEQHEQEQMAIEHCLQQLKAEQRRIVLSVYSPGESIAIIAAETGEKARKLYSKLNSLRKLLLECVQQQLTEEVQHG